MRFRGGLAVLTGLTGLVLGGCSDGGLAATGVASTYVLSNTGKLPTDHLVSAVTGRDCSVLALEKTGYYCPPKIVVDRSGLYCYRTLAGVDCHESPDPYRNGHLALATPAPVLLEQ